MPDRDTLKRLVLEVQKGDQRSLEEFVRVHSPVLEKQVRSSIRRSGLGMHQCDPEDVVGDVWEDLLKNLHKYDGEHDFLAWSAWRHKNRILDIIRKVVHEGKKVDRFADHVARNPQPVSVEDRFVKQDLLLSVLDRLDARDRAIVILRYRYDLSYEQIARALLISPNSVGAYLNKAIKQLKKSLPDECSCDVAGILFLLVSTEMARTFVEVGMGWETLLR